MGVHAESIIAGDFFTVETLWANAFADRWVGTVRRESLDWLLIVSRRQLEDVLRVYVDHYNKHRPHRALDLTPPKPGPRPRLVGSNPPNQIHRRALEATCMASDFDRGYLREVG